MNEADGDQRSIDSIVRAFFGAFDNRNGRRPDLDVLRKICAEDCVIVKATGGEPTFYTLSSFIEPRERLLGGGELVDFFEEEISHRTDIFGCVAQRFCGYRKSGVLSGERFETQGMKTIQLVRTLAGWKISAVAWDDERPGLVIPMQLRSLTPLSPA